MAEDPVFSGFSNGDAASTFADVIAGIKADMKAIEKSAKNIERSLVKASSAKISTPSATNATNMGGNTGAARGTGMALGEISAPPGSLRAGAFATGGIASALSGSGFIPGGIALAGFGDLRVTPNEAMDLEAARFGVAQATGSFSSFKTMMDAAKNDFNVQDSKLFMNTLVTASQRYGMTGMMSGTTVNDRSAQLGQLVGGFNTLAGLAGIDQSRVGAAMGSMYGAPAYYAGMAANVYTYNPLTGEPTSIESMINQEWNKAGMEGMSEEKALQQIDINYGLTSGGRQQLMEMFQGDETAYQLFLEGLRVRARTGEALKEGDLEQQARDIGNRGGIGTEQTQAQDAERAREASELEKVEEYTNDVTEGIAAAAGHIKEANEILTELPEPLRSVVGDIMGIAAELDTLQTHVPNMTKGLTDFFSGLPSLLMAYLLGKSGGLGSLLSKVIPSAVRTAATTAATTAVGAGAAGLAALGAGLVGTTLAVGAAGTWAVNKFTDYDEVGREDVNNAIARNAGRGAPPSSGYGQWGSNAEGNWFVDKDQFSRIHQGEMILPNRVAAAVREELALGQVSGKISNLTAPDRDKGTTIVNINLTIQNASDHEAAMFANRVKRIIDGDRELMAVGAGRLAR